MTAPRLTSTELTRAVEQYRDAYRERACVYRECARLCAEHGGPRRAVARMLETARICERERDTADAELRLRAVDDAGPVANARGVPYTSARECGV